MGYGYRAYCDICNEPSKWFNTEFRASGWRDLHFETQHPDNPMKKQNCRIQRDRVEVLGDYNNKDGVAWADNSE